MNAGRLIVVSGTGTGIGKTHFSEALLVALGRVLPRVAGIKPVETGLGEAAISDAARLERASSFHVKQFGYVFAEPVSPHLAAREADASIEVDVLVPLIQHAQGEVDVLLVELAGGFFTPLSDTRVNADLAAALTPDATFLVGPDRLGVLHELIATTRAASQIPVDIDGLVLVAPEHPDSSTGSNARELGRLLATPVVATLARGAARDLASCAPVRDLAARLARAWPHTGS